MIKDVVEAYWSLSKRDLSVLKLLEKGHRRYEFIPQEVLEKLFRRRDEELRNSLKKLHGLGLLRRNTSPYLGWKITALGYDVLAIHTLRARKKIVSISPTPLGVGKEAVVYAGDTPSGLKIVLKFYRRGVASFKLKELKKLGKVKHLHDLYRTRLSAAAEYFALSKIFEGGGLVPEPITYNRHVVVMAYLDGVELYRLNSGTFEKIIEDVVETLKISLSLGIIHGDLSPYNIIVSRRSYIIDWPQWVPATHPKALKYLRRDFENLEKFFKSRGISLDLGGLVQYVKRGAVEEFVHHFNKDVFL